MIEYASTSNVNSFSSVILRAETWTVNKEEEKGYLHLRLEEEEEYLFRQ